MSLMGKILSSRKQVAAFTVQPYKPYTDISAYNNRFINPVMNNPMVKDRAYVTAPAGSRVRGNNPSINTAGVQILGNGAAPIAGSIAPRRDV